MLAPRARHRRASVGPMRVIGVGMVVAFTHQAGQTKQAEKPDPAVVVMLAAVAAIISHCCLAGGGRIGCGRAGRLPVGGQG